MVAEAPRRAQPLGTRTPVAFVCAQEVGTPAPLFGLKGRWDPAQGENLGRLGRFPVSPGLSVLGGRCASRRKIVRKAVAARLANVLEGLVELLFGRSRSRRCLARPADSPGPASSA